MKALAGARFCAKPVLISELSPSKPRQSWSKPLMGESITIHIPGLKILTENHRYEGKMRHHFRAKTLLKHLVYYSLVEQVGLSWAQAHREAPIAITLTRIAPKKM